MANINGMIVTKEDINNYVALGGSLDLLSEEQLSCIEQKSIEQYVENGGSLDSLTRKQRKEVREVIRTMDIPSSFDLSGLSAEERKAVSQERINQYVANGGNLSGLSAEERKALPQESINQYVANGGDISMLTKEERSAVPLECKKLYIVNQGNLEHLTEDEKVYSPVGILIAKASGGCPNIERKEYEAQGGNCDDFEVDERMVDSLILFASGKLKSDDLPSSIFVNYATRKTLLRIIKAKNVNDFYKQYNKKKRKGAIEDKIMRGLEEKYAEIESAVIRRQLEVIDEYETLAQERKSAMVEENQ